MSASTFGQLLRYARSTELEATENFTTEALAACIRSDGGSTVAALAGLGFVEDPAAIAEVSALTQVARPGAGIIDLVLQLRSPERVSEAWVEVKVAAAESGRQIDAIATTSRSSPTRSVRSSLPSHARPSDRTPICCGFHGNGYATTRSPRHSRTGRTSHASWRRSTWPTSSMPPLHPVRRLPSPRQSACSARSDASSGRSSKTLSAFPVLPSASGGVAQEPCGLVSR